MTDKEPALEQTIEALLAHFGDVPAAPSDRPGASEIKRSIVADGALETLIREQLAMVERVIAQQLDTVRAVAHSNALQAAAVLASSKMAAADGSDRSFAGEDVAGTETARRFWAEMVRDVPPALELPSDRPRPAQRTQGAAWLSGQSDADLAEAARQLAERQRTTLFAVLFAALQAMIGRLADAHDVVLTVPMEEGGLKRLPVRQAFKAEQSFASHLEAVHARMLGVLAHRKHVTGRLAHDLDMRAMASSSRVQFDLEQRADGTGDRPAASDTGAADDCDLYFKVIEGSEGLRIDVGYDADLFDAQTVGRWAGHYRALLRAATANPDEAIGKLNLIEGAERTWLVDTLNATAHPYDRSATIHGLVSAQVRRTPDAVAVRCNGRATSYLQLERASDRLADVIRGQVGGRGGRIAIAVERSVDMLVSLLAVMKAGHAYVPLDPTHPPQRLATTLEMARVLALIATDAAGVTWAGSKVSVLALDTLGIEARGATDAEAARGAAADDPACVLFTSGSTGVPKGVEVGQRAMVNFLLTMAETPGFSARDHVLAVTTVCFDIAGLEFFLPLVTGGSLTIATQEQLRDGFALVELLETSGATVLQSTPSFWQLLLEAGFTPRRGLKMLCGGEPLPRDLADRLTANGAELWNMYGPTETTIWSSCGPVDGGPITIGAPIANTQLFVLDAGDQLRPIGIAGELHIGGDGLANGYFGRPDLTAAAFPEIEISPGRKQRLYRTGDVALRMPDGSLQLHGRRDQQIKLRGYRIEIEEIESVLRKAPHVAAAAATVRGEGGGGARLIAFVVPAAGAELQPKSIMAHAAAALPNYMMPADVVVVEKLPMTGNGKLDRKALKSLPLATAGGGGSIAAPAAAAQPVAPQSDFIDKGAVALARATPQPQEASKRRPPLLADYRDGAMRNKRSGR